MSWDTPLMLLRREITQRRDEGCEVPESLVARIEALDPERDGYDESRVGPLYEELMALPEDAELAAREPNDLAAIRALRRDGPRDLRYSPSDEEALDRFHGAWTGRAMGCALGKPAELIGLAEEGGRVIGRELVTRYLKNRGDYPLRDYFTGRDAGDGLHLWCPRSQREQIACMEPDDDIHYTLVALAVVEQHGPGFDFRDIAQKWLWSLPIYSICTAEAQAIETFQTGSTRPGYFTCAVTPEITRRHRNPYREWIGAQIRSDGWAWMAAGKPELAAELAYRDASWTHERNGIYGAMMFAAMQAAAFVEHDPMALVRIGLSEIPSRCRLALAVEQLLRWRDEDPSVERCMERIEASCAGMSSVHTINNALVCVLALLSYAMAADATVCGAVACGHDTDCNGATVGSIAGAARGHRRLESTLAGRLNDTIKPAMIGFESVTMRDLAARTLAQFRRVEAYERARREATA